MYTTTQVAAMLGTELRNVQNYCKRHNVPKRARDYDISEQDIEGMRAELGRPGRKRRINDATQDNRTTQEAEPTDKRTGL